MTSKDLKKGSIVEIRLNLSTELMNQPIQVKIERTTDKFLWFKYNSLQRISRTTLILILNISIIKLYQFKNLQIMKNNLWHFIRNYCNAHRKFICDDRFFLVCFYFIYLELKKPNQNE